MQPSADPEAFLAQVDLINRDGILRTFARTRYRYLTVGEFTYWVSRSFYPPYGLIVNRRCAEHDQGDGLTFSEDWNEGLSEC